MSTIWSSPHHITLTVHFIEKGGEIDPQFRHCLRGDLKDRQAESPEMPSDTRGHEIYFCINIELGIIIAMSFQ